MKLTASDREYLQGFRGVFPRIEDADAYLEECWSRTEVVMSWLAELQAAGAKDVLELGANPYFLSALIQKHFSFNLELANFFGDPERTGRHTDTIDVNGKRHDFVYEHFNVERAPFPYSADVFDVVLFCEIVEHLLIDPGAVIAEMRRVLRPGGYIIISTPNAVRVANVVQLLRGKNIYSGYSPHGPYGRHNREYAREELEDLVARHGFQIVKSEERDVRHHSPLHRVATAIGPAWWRDHLFVLAQTRFD